jgi:hypothetical protein
VFRVVHEMFGAVLSLEARHDHTLFVRLMGGLLEIFCCAWRVCFAQESSPVRSKPLTGSWFA